MSPDDGIDPQKVGRRIAQRRTRRGLSQREAAYQARARQATWSSWEQGLTVPHGTKLRWVCEVLDVDEDYLLYGKGRPR